MKKLTLLCAVAMCAQGAFAQGALDSLKAMAGDKAVASVQAAAPQAKAVLAGEVTLPAAHPVMTKLPPDMLKKLMASAVKIYQAHGKSVVWCVDYMYCGGEQLVDNGVAVSQLELSGSQNEDGSFLTLTDGVSVCENGVSCSVSTVYRFHIFADGEVDLATAPNGRNLVDPLVQGKLLTDIEFWSN